MDKLRHIAITVSDPEATARFYESTFGMQRVEKHALGVMLTDGVMSLAVLKFPTDAMAGDERGKDFVGLHHMGFWVDDIDTSAARIESNGGKYHMELPGDSPSDKEFKYRDPNGIVFDIVNDDYATGAWGAGR
jgi:methylmalonyl-CoA/ethylmalonyl-CoA epimerase